MYELYKIILFQKYKICNNLVIRVLLLLQFLASGCGGSFSGSVVDSSSLASSEPCLNNTLTSNPCQITDSGVAVTTSIGNDLTTWSNNSSSTTITSDISNGFYLNKIVSFSDPSLLASNIKSGVTIFGVTGNASGIIGNCFANGLQSSNCTATTNSYWTTILGANIIGAVGTLTTTIPAGYYEGTNTVTMNDTNLIASNIKLGTTLFGVSGSLTSIYPTCTEDNGSSNASICSTTAPNRYISSVLGSDITTGTNAGATTTVSAVIPNGYYNGNIVSFTDSNLVANKILNGTILFGVTGSVVAAYNACTDNSLNASQCSTSTNRYVTATAGSAITSWTNASSSTSVSGSISQGFYTNGTAITFTEANLLASNIKSGVSVFNVTGNYVGSGIQLLSNAHHDQTLTPILQTDETTTYAATNLPAAYRDIPDISKDDDGYISAGVSSSQITFATRNSNTGAEWDTGVPRNVCGKGINTSIADKITDCSTQHSVKPSWDSGVAGKISWNGATKANSGQGSWTLVTVYSSTKANGATCDTTCKEVWRDDRTGLLWSDRLNAIDNWCRASGNAQASDPSNFCNNTTYQPNYPISQSWCAEIGPTSIIEAAASSETWSSGTYRAAKGAMGRTTSVSIRWRLPSRYDYEAADLNGIRFVVPGMSDIGGSYEWTSTLNGGDSSYAWGFQGSTGALLPGLRNTSLLIRCVGR